MNDQLSALKGKKCQFVIVTDGASEESLRQLANTVMVFAQRESLSEFLVFELPEVKEHQYLLQEDNNDCCTCEEILMTQHAAQYNKERAESVSYISDYIEMMRTRREWIENSKKEGIDVLVSNHEEPLLRMLFSPEVINALNAVIDTKLDSSTMAEAIFDMVEEECNANV